MRVEQSFEVAAPVQRVWEAMTDVERVTPCLPGAAVTGRNEDGSFNGEFKVKIGPTSAAYTGKLAMEDVDAEARSTTMQAAGTDKRGQGGAKATIVSTMAPAGDAATTVEIASDYTITGRLARFGRGGMIEEIAAGLVVEFADNLARLLAGAGDEASSAPEPVAAPPAPAPPAPAPPAPAPPMVDEPPAAVTPTPTPDPDAVIEGAMPVADVLADEPATPGPVSPGPAPADPAAGGPVVVRRVRENPGPFVALIVGFLVALRVLRRRG